MSVVAFVVFCFFVSAIEGDTPPCSPNEDLNNCGRICEATCKNALIKNRPCPDICLPPACQCKEGYARNSNGECVTIHECPLNELQCPRNEVVDGCGGSCDRKCYNLNLPCPFVCLPEYACVCKDGFARDQDGRCVAVVNGSCTDNRNNPDN